MNKPSETGDKVKALEDLVRIRRDLRRQGNKVVFTNGCFDILHAGHVHLFRQAKSYGDILIVAVNDEVVVQADLVRQGLALARDKLVVFDQQMMILNKGLALEIQHGHAFQELLSDYVSRLRLLGKPAQVNAPADM